MRDQNGAPPIDEGKILGLRIDVDTHEGMRAGVPTLLRSLADAGARGTFFFTMGPDRSGRAVFNLLRPGFLSKMVRTGAPGLYGWRTLVSGTLLPARPIGTAFPELIRESLSAGHEIGVHAWDHRSWQDSVERFSRQRVESELDRGRQAFAVAAGRPSETFAAPAWITVPAALLHQESFDLRYASDCRGTEPFLPLVEGQALHTPQVPNTLPTLDEAVGRTHRTASHFFDDLAPAIAEQRWPVLTVHAEAEGGLHAEAFRRFLRDAPGAGIEICSLGTLLAHRLMAGPLPVCALSLAPVPGRHGRVMLQGEHIEQRDEPDATRPVVASA